MYSYVPPERHSWRCGPIRAGETVAPDAVQSKVRMVPLSALSGISEPASVIGKTARRLSTREKSYGRKWSANPRWSSVGKQ